MFAVYCSQRNDRKRLGVLRLQGIVQILQAHPRLMLDRELTLANAFGDGAEEQDRDHLLSSLLLPRRQTPLLPPRFSSSWIASMRMPRSIALHMS